MTTRAPRPSGPYSQAIVANGLVFVAGQGPADSSGVTGDGIEVQTDRTLQNLKAILEAAGTSLDNVVKVTAHLADLADFDAFNLVYERYFSSPYPVRTTVGSTLRDILVEIDVIATR